MSAICFSLSTYPPSHLFPQADAAFAYDDFSLMKNYHDAKHPETYPLNCLRGKRAHFGQRATFITEFEPMPTKFSEYHQVGWLENYDCWEVKLNFSKDKEWSDGIHLGYFHHDVHAAMVHAAARRPDALR